jgi:Protein of unknown function (DUF3551)
MRTTFAAVTILGLMLLSGASQAAPQYPWCAVDSRAGTYTCIFVTPQQCMAYASGLGYCQENPYIDSYDRRRTVPRAFRG